jgi:mannose-1-phosphate guanylyltransferase
MSRKEPLGSLRRTGVPSHALVLTAGLGTRLHPLTRVRAKPAIPVAGEPLIRRIVRWLVANGVTDLTLNLHHLPETLTAVVGDASDLSARVRYSWEQPAVLGTAGGPRQALPIVDADTFFLVNGDTLSELNLAVLADSHAASGALVTLALAPSVDLRRYGGVQLDADGGVRAFVPRGSGARGAYHFVGVQIVSAEVFRELPPGEPADSIGGLYDAVLVRRPGAIHGCVGSSRFWDIGTVADYWHTSEALSGETASVQRGRRVHIEPTAKVTESILWDDVEIGAGCTIDRCIVTDGVRIAAGTAHRRSILLRANGRPAGFGERVENDVLVCPMVTDAAGRS